MRSYYVFFMFFPIKLLFFKFSRFFDFLTFLLKTHVSHIIDFINILNKLLSFLLSVVIYFKWTLRSHKIWISLVMIGGRNLLSIKSQSYYCSYIILVLSLVWNRLVGSHSWLTINTISCLENLMHFSLTFRKILIRILIVFCFAFINLAVWMLLNYWVLNIIISLVVLAEFSILIELIGSCRSLWIQNSWMLRFQAGNR